ncbi:MAG TPA: ABC transporter permease [Terracidiphilus sp.]|nr:ABC transporter permease [Terracidiphilus sp.]
MSWLTRIKSDVVYSARQFRRAPGYAAFTILVLALGIGTVTAMFTVVYAVLLKPLPFNASGRLFQLDSLSANDDVGMSFPFEEIRAWQQATKGTAQIAFSGGGLNIADGPSGAELITEVEVSNNLFDLLGARPMMGRLFIDGAHGAGDANGVVLSYSLWQKEFGGDPQVIGKLIHIGGVARTVTGVMQQQFLYPVWDDRPEAWVPVDPSELTASSSDTYSYLVPLVRVNKGIPAKDVEAQLKRVHARYVKPGDEAIRLQGVRDLLVADVRPALRALIAAVILVWMIACSNVAGLMLARVAARRTEIAVRAALGAGWQRIAQQFLVESLMLSGAGAAVGLGIAVLLLRVFQQVMRKNLPLAGTIHWNGAVWAGLVVLAVLTGLIFGAAPAMVAARAGIQNGLKNSGRAQAGSRSQNRLRALLLVGQVALSIALLTGAGLMLRTMYALRHAPLGFRTDHLVLTSLTVPNDLYGKRNVGTVVWNPLLEKIRQTPGVRSAALSTVLPIQHPVELITLIYATQWMHGDASATVRAATPELMDALGVRMRRGRFFTAEDTVSSLPVMVVNQTFVNRYLGGGDAVGKVVRYGRDAHSATVVGVMEDVHQDGVAEKSKPEFYLCMSQIGPDNSVYRALLGRVMQVAVRTEIAPAALIPTLRQAIHDANPHLAIGECTSMAEAVEDSVSAQKMAALVIGVFGGLVLLITAVGLYGLLNFLVAQRTPEIGIRMALGANRVRVIEMVMGQLLIWLAAGTLLGVGLALASGRLLEAYLFGVRATDPWSMALAPLTLLFCGVLAALVPVKRAVSINPVDALRAE